MGTRHHEHLGVTERDVVAGMHAAGQGASDIAGAIGGDRPVVSRGLAGNGRRGRYGACATQRRAEARHGACRGGAPPHR